MPNWNGTWSGGSTYLTKDGKNVWVIRKMAGGKRSSITLDVTSERAAEAELDAACRDAPRGGLTRPPGQASGAFEQGQPRAHRDQGGRGADATDAGARRGGEPG